MSRFPLFAAVLGLFVSAFFQEPAWSQEPDLLGKGGAAGRQAATSEAEPATSIFNGELKRFKFEFQDEVVTVETAEEFMVRYQRPNSPPIIGAYPDTRSNALFVVGPPEAEQAIRESLAQWIVDSQGLSGAMPLEMQLRILQNERKNLLLTMADLEIQEVAAAAQENGPQKAKQLADRRQMFEDQLKIAEQQIRVVRKYMARLAADDEAPATTNP